MGTRPKNAWQAQACVLLVLAAANGITALMHMLFVFLKMREGFLPFLFFMLERSTVLLPLNILLCGVTAVLFLQKRRSPGGVLLLIGALAGIGEWCVFEIPFSFWAGMTGVYIVIGGEVLLGLSQLCGSALCLLSLYHRKPENLQQEKLYDRTT